MLEHVAITGGNGYLGRPLINLLRSSGVIVSSLGRKKPIVASDTGLHFFVWELPGMAPEQALQKSNGDPVDAVIHLAHQWDDLRPLEENSNVSGTRVLLEQAREMGVKRFVVASTPSANAEASNQYGRVKYEIQQMLKNRNELALQITIAYGGQRSSQWGTICNLVSALPVLPMVAPGTKVQIVHISKVCEAFMKLAELPEPSMNVYAIGGEESISFGAFLRKTARLVCKRPLIILPVPLNFALLAAAICRRIPGLPNVSADRVKGISGIKRVDTSTTLTELNIDLGSFEQEILSEPGKMNRALLGESATLLRYVSGNRPSNQSLKVYVRAVAQGDNVKLAKIPFLAKLIPQFLCLFDRQMVQCDQDQNDLRRRIETALTIADATDGRSFYKYEGCHPVVAFTGLCLTGFLELLILPFRFLYRRKLQD